MSRRTYPTSTHRFPSVAVRPATRGGTLLGYYETAEEAQAVADHFLNSPPVPTEELLGEQRGHQ